MHIAVLIVLAIVHVVLLLLLLILPLPAYTHGCHLSLVHTRAFHAHLLIPFHHSRLSSRCLLHKAVIVICVNDTSISNIHRWYRLHKIRRRFARVPATPLEDGLAEGKPRFVSIDLPLTLL